VKVKKPRRSQVRSGGAGTEKRPIYRGKLTCCAYPVNPFFGNSPKVLVLYTESHKLFSVYYYTHKHVFRPESARSLKAQQNIQFPPHFPERLAIALRENRS
jgi:hypothetical protein